MNDFLFGLGILFSIFVGISIAGGIFLGTLKISKSYLQKLNADKKSGILDKKAYFFKLILAIIVVSFILLVLGANTIL